MARKRNPISKEIQAFSRSPPMFLSGIWNISKWPSWWSIKPLEMESSLPRRMFYFWQRANHSALVCGLWGEHTVSWREEQPSAAESFAFANDHLSYILQQRTYLHRIRHRTSLQWWPPHLGSLDRHPSFLILDQPLILQAVECNFSSPQAFDTYHLFYFLDPLGIVGGKHQRFRDLRSPTNLSDKSNRPTWPSLAQIPSSCRSRCCMFGVIFCLSFMYEVEQVVCHFQSLLAHYFFNCWLHG